MSNYASMKGEEEPVHDHCNHRCSVNYVRYQLVQVANAAGPKHDPAVEQTTAVADSFKKDFPGVSIDHSSATTVSVAGDRMHTLVLRCPRVTACHTLSMVFN